MNAVFPEQKVELDRTCVQVLDKSVSPMQNTFNCRFSRNRQSAHQPPYKVDTPGLLTGHDNTEVYAP
jgi:hypothetical protein